MKRVIGLIVVILLFAGCGGSKNSTGKSSKSDAVNRDEMLLLNEVRPDFSSPVYEDSEVKIDNLPEELKWYTSNPGIWGSERAKQGGTQRLALSEFPQTFRTIGPNSNGGFRSYLLASAYLISINTETMEWMPQLATHWAFSKDKKTVYFKLNEKAKWNDGVEITADDYVFLLDMMRSKNIKAPWYNDRYTRDIVDIKKYDKYLISVTGNIERGNDDLLYNLTISPKPKHHYNGEIPDDFVDRYQWVYEPTPGPYRMENFEKGESVTFKKVDNWWGYCYDYNKYRYNIDTVELKVITGGLDIQKQYFLNGEIDSYGLIIPKEWAASDDFEIYKKGYIDRHYNFYSPLTGLSGIVLNTQAGIFKDINVRTGLYYSINIQKMIDTVLRGEYERYHNIGLAHVFAGINFDDYSIRKPDFDPKIAGEYFDKAGFINIGDDGIRVDTNGKRLSFQLLYTSDHLTQRLSVLKEEARKAGLEIELNHMAEGGFTILLEKKHEAFFLGMSTSLIPATWQYYHSENAKAQTNNFSMIDDPDLDQLINQYRDESDLNKKAELNKLIQKRVHELALVIPGYYVPYIRAASWKWVRFPKWLNTKYGDSFVSPLADIMEGYVGYSWIDEDIKKEVIQAKIKGKTFEPRTYIDRTNEQ